MKTLLSMFLFVGFRKRASKEVPKEEKSKETRFSHHELVSDEFWRADLGDLNGPRADAWFSKYSREYGSFVDHP
jgi:hypothetical protein